MSGVLSAIAAGSGANMVAVLATTGGDVAGVTVGVSGTLTPSVLQGTSVLTIDSNPGGFDLRIFISGIYTQTGFFRRVRVTDGDGVLQAFTAAAADSFTAVSGESSWTWGTGASPVWTAPDDVGESKLIIFEF